MQLNRNQFVQDVLEGAMGEEVAPAAPAPHDPGPNTKRGTVGEGQLSMNFDVPGAPHETSTAGLVPVGEWSDPDWDNSAWEWGGNRRNNQGNLVQQGWERAPVETIGPDQEVRTNQGRPGLPQKWLNAEVDHAPDHVAKLRDAGAGAFTDTETGERALPWIAQVNDKRYLLEGHHRAIAARSRDTGEFPAHVLRGKNWGQIEEQVYDGPRSR